MAKQIGEEDLAAILTAVGAIQAEPIARSSRARAAAKNGATHPAILAETPRRIRVPQHDRCQAIEAVCIF